MLAPRPGRRGTQRRIGSDRRSITRYSHRYRGIGGVGASQQIGRPAAARQADRANGDTSDRGIPNER
ncbi:hypothetical protein QIG52_26745, partial [Klebsiella pneumoniae]|nr:hypothetical protein [Klebsiella pneumoniae]